MKVKFHLLKGAFTLTCKSLAVYILLAALLLPGCTQAIGKDMREDSEASSKTSIVSVAQSTPSPTPVSEPIVTVNPVSTPGSAPSAEPSEASAASPENTAPKSTKKSTATPKPTQKPAATATPKPTEKPATTAAPAPVEAPVAEEAPVSAPDPTPEPTPEPREEMSVAGSDYGQKVLQGVNEVRETQGVAQLSYGGVGNLLDRCKEMARGGTLLAPKGSSESTSKANDGGRTMGISSAVHAYGIGTGDYTTLYVASVVYNGTRWTIVRAE